MRRGNALQSAARLRMACQVGNDRFDVPAQGGGGRGGEAGLISSGADSGRQRAGNEEPNRDGRDAASEAVARGLNDGRSDSPDVAADSSGHRTQVDQPTGNSVSGKSVAPGHSAPSEAAPSESVAPRNSSPGEAAPGASVAPSNPAPGSPGLDGSASAGNPTPGGSASSGNSASPAAPTAPASAGNSGNPVAPASAGNSGNTASASAGNSASAAAPSVPAGSKYSAGADNSAPANSAGGDPAGPGVAEPAGQRIGYPPAPGGEPHEATAHDAAAEISTGDRSATYRDALGNREFRYLFSAIVLSLLGDQLAKVALSFLVYQKTSSALLTALSYGISYLPWVLGGPVLATFADRLPRRRVMIVCDIARAMLIAVLAIPGMPVSALLVLLLVASMFTPPFESARSSLTTQILTGDVYVVGNGLTGTATQICNVVGLFAGGALVMVIHPRGALIADAATFLLSAGLIVFGVVERAVASRPAATSTWLEISAGARVVFGTPTLRSIVLIVWISSVCSFAWEGIAVPWAHELGGGARTVGLLLGVSAAGTTVGSIIIGRVCPPNVRRRLILPLAVLAPALLGLVLADNALPLDVLVLIFSGFGMAFVIPLNALFMQSLPVELRGRAFGVAQGGLQATQGLGVLLAGALVGMFSITTTVGVLGLIGAAATLAIGLLQPIRTD